MRLVTKVANWHHWEAWQLDGDRWAAEPTGPGAEREAGGAGATERKKICYQCSACVAQTSILMAMMATAISLTTFRLGLRVGTRSLYQVPMEEFPDNLNLGLEGLPTVGSTIPYLRSLGLRNSHAFIMLCFLIAEALSSCLLDSAFIMDWTFEMWGKVTLFFLNLFLSKLSLQHRNIR